MNAYLAAYSLRLIAVMLGRLKMDVQSCIDAYVEMSSAIFEPNKHTLNFPGRATDFVLVKGKFDSEKLAQKIRDTITRYSKEEAEARFTEDDPDPRCRV